MSRLLVYKDMSPSFPLFDSFDAEEIAVELKKISVGFQRWEISISSENVSTQDILNAYQPYLDSLMGDTGAGSADVVNLTPDHPEAAALRMKFLAEHIHTEPEVRFFVSGSGRFVLHEQGHVYDTYCEKGDLIFVPAGIKHWFDAGPRPDFTALRVFTDTAGWVPHFTGDDISSRFPAA
jgi:1,2-dihydroxy-3-keto-5-methylthiopentene dioxygenase